MNATTKFFRQIEREADRVFRLKRVSEPGSVDVAEESQELRDVRGRIEDALDGEDVAQGVVATISAFGIGSAPLIVRVAAGGRFWACFHVGTKWERNTSDYLAVLTYEVNEIVF